MTTIVVVANEKEHIFEGDISASVNHQSGYLMVQKVDDPRNNTLAVFHYWDLYKVIEEK